jgi:hypothetical protein
MSQRCRLLLPVLPAIFAAILAALPAGVAAQSIKGFIENKGQINPRVRYYAIAGSVRAYFTDNAIVVDLTEQGRAIYARPEAEAGSAGFSAPVYEAAHEAGTRIHMFTGNDPAGWHANIPVYEKLIRHDKMAGVDIVFRIEPGRITYEIRGGGNMPAIRFTFEGADRIVTGEDGVIRLQAGGTTLTDRPIGIATRALDWGDSSGGSDSDPSDDPSDPLRDNPYAVSWSTFLGGGDNDYAHGLVLDQNGNPVVTGYSRSANFPVTPGAYDLTEAGSYDVIVAKLNATGTALLWATFIGGDLEDRAFDLELEADGRVVVCGHSYSQNFPITATAFDHTLGGERDAFVAMLSSGGDHLLWSTYLGGSDLDRLWDLALDSEGRPIVVGETFSADLPTTPNVFDSSPGTLPDAFMTKMDIRGSSLVWSTYVGGNSSDQITRVVLTSTGNPVVSGNTASTDFPTSPGAFDRSYNGSDDCFIASFDPDAVTLLYGTYLGGPGSDMGNALALAPGDEPVAAGSTSASGYPVTAGAYDRTFNGVRDIFVTRINSTGSALVFSTLIGGNDLDEPFAMAVDPSGCPVLTGGISSADYPTTSDAFDRTYGGSGDAFLSRLSADGRTLVWSSYLGGTAGDGGWEIVQDPEQHFIVTGPTRSADFPVTPGSYDGTHGGQQDIFIIRFNILPSAAVGDPDVFGTTPFGPSEGPRVVVSPNPFNGPLDVRFDLPQTVAGRLVVLDPTGRIVARIEEGLFQRGNHAIHWDGRDARGRSLSPGVYWIALSGGSSNASTPAIRIR